MTTQQSQNMVAEEDFLDTTHNKVVTDITALFDAGAAGYNNPNPLTAASPVMWCLRHYTGAFTFGTAPFTSNGYLRLPGGNPWGADGVYQITSNASLVQGSAVTTTTPNQLVLTQPYLFPALPACTVTKIEISLGLAQYGTATSAGLDKIELEVFRVSAAGVETTHATIGVNSSANAAPVTPYESFQRVLSADLSASPFSIGATDRLGFRIRVYGHGSGAASSWTIIMPIDTTNAVNPTAPTAGITSVPVAVYFQ